MSANGGSSNYRNIPDVALTGNQVWVDYGEGSSGEFGGTSCATPLWAAFTALVNEQEISYGGTTVGFLNPALYALGLGANYNSVFHDITTGNNTWGSSPNEFYAEPGYDLCTGWGTPAGASLINALAPQPDPLLVLPATGFSSAGLIGGPFSINSESFALTNDGAQTLTWSVNNTNSWLGLTSSGGALSPGASAAVAVSLNAASSLAAGTYTGNVSFIDDTTGVVLLRQFVLTVSSQLIQNGGFELGSFADWTLSGNSGYAYITTGASYVHSGTYGAELGPLGSLGYLSQTVSTAPGKPYVLSLWLDNPPKGGTPNQFNVSWNGVTVFNQTNLPSFSWTNLHYTFVPSTSTTTIKIGFRNDPSYFGLDDISVSPIAAPSLGSMIKAANSMQFSMNTTVNATYQLQYTTNLAGGPWINLGSSFLATSTTTVVTDPSATDQQRFYRVIIVP